MPSYLSEEAKKASQKAIRSDKELYTYKPSSKVATSGKDSTSWFKGSQPTEAETLAQIYRVAQQDQARGEQALSLYNKAKSDGAWNEPYSKPTTQYGDLVGIDPITLNDDNIKSLVPYLQGGVLTSTGSLSSAKKNGTDAQYAYNLSGLMQDYENTKAYLAEQDEIVREAQYWIRKGLSDEEIKAKLNIGGEGTKYTKIKNAIDKAKVGEVVRTTSPLWAATSYGIDSMLWGLRNPDQTTGDKFYDAVQMELGRGNAYVRDEERMSRLDATSDNYNPYMVGTTMDDLAIKYGVDQFDERWLQQNRALLNSPDTAKDYNKIFTAYENTSMLQEEAERFKTELARYVEQGVQPDYDSLFAEGTREGKFDNLKKLDESLKSGKLYDTTAAIDFDLKALMAETDAAVKLKQAQMKAAEDEEAKKTAVEAEKESWFERVAGWFKDTFSFKDDPIPESTTSKPDTLYDEAPEVVMDEGIRKAAPISKRQQDMLAVASGDMAAEDSDYSTVYSTEEIISAVQNGDYAVAASMTYADIQDRLKRHPELMTSDDTQKAALTAFALAARSEGYSDEEIATTYMKLVEDSMGLDEKTYQFFDAAFGGALSETSDNEGIGVGKTAMFTLMTGGNKFNDFLANAAGMIVTGYGYAVRGTNWLLNQIGIQTSDDIADKIQNAGQTISSHYDEKIAEVDAFMRENATTTEYLAYTAGSEAVKMSGMTTASALVSSAAVGDTVGKVTTALEANKLAQISKYASMIPFMTESSSAEFHQSLQESDSFLTATLSAAIAGFATAATADIGVLKNIEKMGGGPIVEVVNALSAVPGAGVKTAAKRYGKGMLMYLGNLIKSGANEGIQEGIENILTTSATAGLKGEEFSFDKEYAAELGRDFIMGAIGGITSSLGILPNYAESVIVANANSHKSVLTAADVAAQIEAFEHDVNNPEVMNAAAETAAEVAVGMRTGELIAEGAMDSLDSSAVEDAQTKLADTEAALAEANTAFNANPADDAAKNEVLRLIKERDAARAEAEKVQADYDAAAAELMSTVREQARAEVTQNMAAVQEARMQQEAAAEVQRQNDNVLAMQANDFVEKFFGQASADVKDQVRKRYMSSDESAQNVARGAVELASTFSKKFNLSITFTDSHGIFEGAYTGGNNIVLDKNATQGEVIRRVLVHEITHAAESSKAYDALADAVLSAYYGGNTDQMNADLADIAQQYAEQAGQDGQSVARSELVAQRLSEMLSGNQDAMNRLVEEKPDVATRIWRAIKDFIGKLRGVRDPELDNLMKLEKQLEKALRSRGSEKNKTAFSIAQTEDGAKYVVVDTDQNIFDGKEVSAYPKIAREYIKERFRGTVIGEGDNRAYVDAKTGQEYTNPANRRMPQDVFSAKMKTATELDNLLKASVVEGHNPPTDRHPEFPGGFDLYETVFSVSGQMFSGRLNIGVDANNRRRLYDLTQIKSLDSGSWIKQHGGAAVQTSSQGFSADSLTQEPAKVNLSIPSKSGEPVAEIIKGGATKFSLTSWNENEKAEVRKSLIQNGFGPANVDKWMDDVNGVAAIIAADKGRLDYKAADNQVMLKNNQEYVKTLDASTLCAKRLLYQGTFNEIQHMLPNTVLTSEDLLHLSDMMNQAGLETPCGVCYVESRRRHLGKFAQEWLDSYIGEYKPTLDEVTTTDGLEALRINHPETYRSFVDTMNSKGSANPKVVQLRTDYRGDIRKLTKGETKKIVKIGGLRIQSFSDFETPHLIDMMQAVLDMSSRKLPAQAYTKVPNFAWVFGDTGIKINLSLLAEGNGLNEDGTLRFSSKEGMDIDEAMRLRERYSENVGTILVGVSEEHIRAAMADPRIDYIIPFHKSGWGQNELNLLPVLNSYDNFEDYQNERTIVGYRKNGKPKYGRPKGGNFYPIDYWDYSKTGDENAATYLRMCEEDGRVPKFEQFLEKDAEGHWVAPSGYWKMLIDFKMYDNDGNGSPQKAVLPIFNMEEAARVLNEYEGGADTLPVAYDIADRFVSEKKASNPSVKFSLPSNDILDQRIAQHRNSQLAPAPNDIIPNGGEQEQNFGTGERQFAGQTIQNSTVVPDWVKQEFLRPEELNYEVDTNREQVERSWQRIQENGYEAERDRLLSLDRYSADDTAEANLMMAMALREDTADPATFMALASHYNKEGTKAGQELQARKLFTRMSPTGARVWAAGQMESNLEEHMRTHQPQRRRVDENARRVADQIRDMQGGDEILRLNAGGDFTIDESNNRWGIPINEQQQALIDHYGLNNVGRPGIFYNRATTRQRMLEAILATPNPLEVTGLGLNLIQRLEFMRDGEAVITNADLNYIGTQLGQFVALGEEAGGRAADLALARAYEAFGNITPATRMEKFRTQRYVNMLSTFTSFARNIIGNVGQNVANAAAHGIAVEIDRLTSLGTGRRTMAHLSTAERIEGWRAFAEETRNTFLDFFVDRANTAPNRDRYSTNQRGRVFQNGALEMSKDIESFLMSVGDRNIWRKAFVNSLAEQQKLADRNQLFNDDGTTRTHEQMVEHAEAAANYATFTEDSLAQDIMQFIRQRSPVAADVLGLYMPFTGVPHNIMKRNFQYSPIGFLTMAGRMAANRINGRNFDQNAFVNDLSRALTGTGGVLMGVVLGLAGAIKMGTEDEQKDKVYDVETALGEQYTPYVYDPTTDTYVSMSTFAPAASPLVWGAAIGQQLKNDEFNANVLLSALSSSVDSIFDASYLSGLSDLFGGYGSFTENLAHVTAENLASQLTPAFFNQVANAMDPYVRDTKDKDYLTELMKTTLNRIPLLRNQMLPEKVTVAGENVMTKQGWSLVDPFTRTNPSDNAALIEVKRLYDAVGDTAVLPSDALRSRKNSLTLNKKSVALNDQQKAEYKKYYGDLWTSEVSALMATPAYQLMDDEERAAKVEKIMTDALKRAKKEFIERYGE